MTALNLEQRDVTGVRLARVDLLRDALQVRLGRVDTLLHLRDLVANDLMVGESLAEGLATARPLHGLLQTNSRGSLHTGTHPHALGVEVVHDHLKAAVLLADQVQPWHAYVVEIDRRRIRCPPTLFSLERGAANPFTVGRYQQHRYALRTLSAGAHGGRKPVGTHAAGNVCL